MRKSEEEGPRVAALTADIIFAARIRGAAEAAGTEVALARSAEALLERSVGAVRLVFVDLDARQVDAPGLIRALKAAGAPAVVAFGSHVRTEALQAAREAGADRVLARSAFVRELPELLRSAAS